MNKYKSLLYREWKLSRGHYLIRLVLLLLFVGVIVFVCGFLDGPDASFDITTSYLFVVVAATVASGDNGVFKSDINSNWMRYSYTLPVTAFEKAVVRYMIRFLAIVLGMSIAILCTVGICVAKDGSLSGNTIMHFFLILDVCLINDMLIEMIILRARNTEGLKKMNTIADAVVFGCIFITVLILFVKRDEVLSMLDFVNAIGFLAIPLMIVLLIIGFIFAWKNLERREG